MRTFFFTCLAAFLFSCNSSSKKKDPNQTMDDTARMDHPTTPAQPAAAIEPVKIPVADIPVSIKVKGKLQEAWKWNDNLGENILITSSVAPYNDKGKNEYGEEGQTAELNVFHYVKGTGDYQLLWDLNDREKSCPYDITCEFINGSTIVTDLDKDGIAETTVQYKLACRSDVSPANMKLIMHEGKTKYALQGLMWYGSPEEKFEVTESNANLETLPGYKKTEDEYYKTFGRYQSEKEFAGAPAEFLSHARSRWMRFVKESSE